MIAGIQKVTADLVPAIALEHLDGTWGSTLAGSLPGRLWLAIKRWTVGIAGQPAGNLGSYLQACGFLVIVALALALGAPQFVNDKEGLALFVLFGLGLRLLGSLIGGKEDYTPSAIDSLVIALLYTNIIATAASHYLVPSLKGLIKVLVYVASYFLFVGAFAHSRKRAVIVMSALVAAGLVVALYGLYQYKIGVAPLATWEDPNVEIKGTRIYSTLGNPNLLAGYLVPMVPVAFALAMASAWIGRWWLSLPALAVSGILAVATVLTGSRGGYVGLFAAGLSLTLVPASWLWKAKPKARLIILAAMLLLPVLALLAVHLLPAFEQRLLSIFAGREHTSNSFRLNVWHASWLMFLDNWWFGIGPGNQAFRLAYGLYMRSGFDALGTYCVPLEVAVETGVIGLAAFGALLTSLFARAHLSFWRSNDSVHRWLVVGCTSAIVGLMAHGLVDTVFYRPQVQFIFWLMVAIVVALSLSPGKPGQSSDP